LIAQHVAATIGIADNQRMATLSTVSDPTVPPRPARYDEVADFYLAEMGEAVTDPGTAALLELVGPVEGRRVLDLACGHGRVTRELIRRGATVTGLDISDALLARARTTEQAAPLGARYVHGDAAGSVDLPAGWFDAVVCNYGLSDIDDLAGTLGNVHTLLRPGGAFVFSLLHPCFPGWGNDVAAPGRQAMATLRKAGGAQTRARPICAVGWARTTAPSRPISTNSRHTTWPSSTCWNPCPRSAGAASIPTPTQCQPSWPRTVSAFGRNRRTRPCNS
jgi:SAM-dependent methyltransferase